MTIWQQLRESAWLKLFLYVVLPGALLFGLLSATYDEMKRGPGPQDYVIPVIPLLMFLLPFIFLERKALFLKRHMVRNLLAMVVLIAPACAATLFFNRYLQQLARQPFILREQDNVATVSGLVTLLLWGLGLIGSALSFPEPGDESAERDDKTVLGVFGFLSVALVSVGFLLANWVGLNRIPEDLVFVPVLKSIADIPSASVQVPPYIVGRLLIVEPHGRDSFNPDRPNQVSSDYISELSQAWRDLPESLKARVPVEIGTVALLEKLREPVGRYGNTNNFAYRITRRVTLIDRGRNTLIVKRDFFGGPPPQRAHGDAYGSDPLAELVNWLLQLPRTAAN